MVGVKDVDDYIAQAPPKVQGRLKELRATIMAAAPNAKEYLSYGIPSYGYKGRLVYFAFWKKHIGLYALSTPVLEKFASELKEYVTPKGTVQLPLDEEFPTDLVSRLVTAQVKEHDEAEGRR